MTRIGVSLLVIALGSACGLSYGVHRLRANNVGLIGVNVFVERLIVQPNAEKDGSLTLGELVPFFFGEPSMEGYKKPGRHSGMNIEGSRAPVSYCGSELVRLDARNEFYPCIDNHSICGHSSAIGDFHLDEYPFPPATLFKCIVRESGNAKSRPQGFFMERELQTGVFRRLSGFPGLPAYSDTSTQQYPRAYALRPRYEYVPPWHILLSVLALVGLVCVARQKRDLDWVDGLLALTLVIAAGVFLFVGHEYYYDDGHEPYQQNSVSL